MKKTFTLSFALICSLFSFAQVGGYQVEIFQENYNDLTGATEVTNSLDQWDDPEFAIPIGFLANILGYTTNTLYTGGSVGGAFFTDENYYSQQGGAGLLFYFADLIDRQAGGGEYSPISYIVEGDPGDQIFKFEYKNAGFYNEVSYADSTESFINVQFWLHESDGSWETRIGPNEIANPDQLFEDIGGPIVGMAKFDSTELEYLYLVNDQVDPAVLDSIGYDYYALVGITPPEANTVIRISQMTSSTKSPERLTGVTLYPTIANNELSLDIDNTSINMEDVQVRIYDINGRIFYQNNEINLGKTIVPVSHLSNGQYYLSVQSKEKHTTLRFLKEQATFVTLL